jgi:integrase
MPRKRELDPYVSSFVDKAGKERFRFRRGKVSVYMPPPGSKEYKAAYAKAKGEAGVIGKVVEGTINDLVSRFYRTVQFRRTSEAWQKTMRQAIEPFREEYGNDRVEHFRPKDIDKILEDRFEQSINDKGKKVGGSASAERLREMLMRLFKLAKKLEWRSDNPVELSEPVRHGGEGFHPWDEGDIAAYRERWPLGTKARLAMELMLWTGARRSDAHLMAPPKGGLFMWRAAKTGKMVAMPVAPQLQAAIDAMPEGTIGDGALILTEFGKPFSRAGFGNWFGDRCRDAGLKQRSAHGLRKALTRRAADLNVSQQGLKALGQWENDEEVRIYAGSANRNRMAEEALAAVVAWEQETNIV